MKLTRSFRGRYVHPPAHVLAEGTYPRMPGLFSKFQTGRGKFYQTVYNEDFQGMSPQVQMEMCRQMFAENGHIHAGVLIFQDLVSSGGLLFKCKDTSIEKEVNEYLHEINFPRQLNEIVEHLITVGNAYVEIVRPSTIDQNENRSLPKFRVIPYPEKVYIDIDDEGEVDSYVQRIDGPIQGYGLDIAQKIVSQRIRLPDGGIDTVIGLRFEKKNIIHFAYGIGAMGLYGESPFSAAAGDAMIVTELVRSLAVMARYKAINKTVVTLKDVLDEEDMGAFRDDLDALADFENLVTNKEIGLTKLFDGDLNVAPLIDALKFLSQRMTASLVPPYLLHGETSTYAEAREQRTAFFLRVINLRLTVSSTIRPLIRKIVRGLGHNIGRFELEFNELDPMTDFDKKEESKTLWEGGLMTMNEVRAIHGLPPVTVYGDYFNFEVQSGVVSPPQPMHDDDEGDVDKGRKRRDDDEEEEPETKTEPVDKT
jgi:hypothetical protein